MRGILIDSHQPSLYIARLPKFSKYCWVWRSGAFVSRERVGEADPGHRLLLDAIDMRRLRDPDHVEDRRADIADVSELRPQTAAVVDPLLAADDQRVARPPRCEAICFPQLNGVLLAHAQAEE